MSGVKVASVYYCVGVKASMCISELFHCGQKWQVLPKKLWLLQEQLAFEPKYCQILNIIILHYRGAMVNIRIYEYKYSGFADLHDRYPWRGSGHGSLAVLPSNHEGGLLIERLVSDRQEIFFAFHFIKLWHLSAPHWHEIYWRLEAQAGHQN